MIARRIGWVYHAAMQPAEGIQHTLECHTAVLDAVLAGRARQALAATEALMALSRAMGRSLLRHADPALFDCNRAAAGQERASPG